MRDFMAMAGLFVAGAIAEYNFSTGGNWVITGINVVIVAASTHRIMTRIEENTK